MSTKPKIVVIGGGTGTFVTLTGLQNNNIELSAIVAMTDSGGSTGRLRDQLGVLPPGDLRRALVALSKSPDIWRKLFAYRFDSGDLKDHNFGNIFLSALEKITGSTELAVKEISKILNISGKIIPVTYSDCTLCAKYKDGSVIEGEARIDVAYTKRPRISYMYLSPEAILNPQAEKVINEANWIILGPGDLYTSIIPNLLINGISDVISNSKAKKVYIMNLMTKLGETDDFKASDFVYEIERYLGAGFLDYVIVNNKSVPLDILEWYKRSDNVSAIEDDLSDKYVTEAKIVRKNVLSEAEFKNIISDRLKRSLIRHDPEKLAKVIMTLVDSGK